MLVAVALVANLVGTQVLAAGSTARVVLGIVQAPLLVAAAVLVLAGQRERSARARTRTRDEEPS